VTSLYAKNLAQIVVGTLRLVNDYQAGYMDGKTWSWLEVQAKANDVILELVRRTGILKDSRVIFLEETTQVYTLPPECIRLLRVGINKITGSVVLPTTISERDYAGLARSDQGSPIQFYRDHSLAPNQIGFIPTPNQDGSSFVRDEDTGLLRRIADADGNTLPYDANAPLRRIRGVPFRRTGAGRIIRGLISLYGNIKANYVRAPQIMERPDDYPDPEIPVYIHKDIKYGVAGDLIRGSRKPIHAVKQRRFSGKWAAIAAELQRNSEHLGSQDDARPM